MTIKHAMLYEDECWTTNRARDKSCRDEDFKVDVQTYEDERDKK